MLSWSQFGERPHRHGTHQGRWISEQLRDSRNGRWVFGVASRDQHISNEAVAAGALDSRCREPRPKASIVEAEQFNQRRAVGGDSCGECSFLADGCKFVPRADG